MQIRENWRWAAYIVAVGWLMLLADLARGQEVRTNMAWVPNATTTRWQGAWRVVAPTSLVICGATANSNESSAPIVQFQSCATFVYACTVATRVSPPVTNFCPPGSYTGERFIPRATVAGAPSECPPQPAAETRPQACPAGTLGQWTQTRTYSSAPAPQCWVAGEWLPTSPPPGACPPIPPLAIHSFTATPDVLPADGGQTTLAWSASAVDGCTINNAPVPVSGSRVEILSPDLPEWFEFTLGCQQQGQAVTRAVTIQLRKPAICYPLSDVPPVDWNPITGWKLVWYGTDLLPRGWVVQWQCRKPDDTLRSYCVGSRFDELNADAEEIKNGDKARKDQAWRAANWRPFSPEERAACDALGGS